MRSHRNSPRPRLEHLEDRCTPGSALDLFADPLLAPLGRSLVLPEARETAVSRLLPDEQMGSSSQSLPAPPPGDTGANAVLLAAASLSQGPATPTLVGAGGLSALVREVQGEQVPFKGSLDGDVTHTPVDARTDFVLVEAVGTATQLGRFEVTVPHLVDLPTRTAVGSYEFTAANGDKVYAEFTGQASPTATPGVISIVETATVTGGTGRFAGATGSFTVERLYDRIAGTTAGSFEGTITLGVGQR